MHIVHYIDIVKSEMGGTVTAVLDMAVELTNRGHQVSVLTHQIGEDEHALLRKRGIPVHVAGTSVLHGVLLPSDLRAWRAHVAAADVAHLHGIWSPAMAQVAWQARRRDRPFLVTTHGMLSHWAMAQKPAKKRVYWAGVLRPTLRGAAAVHVTAASEENQSKHWLPDVRVACIPYIFRPEKYLRASSPEPTRRYPGLPTDRPLLLFLSRLHPKKGLHHLVDALRHLEAAGCAFHLAVAGEWESSAYKSRITRAIEDAGLVEHVTFLGFVGGAAKVSLLQQVDLLVLPTSQENFGFVTYESLAAGTPAAITTGVDTWRELSESGGVAITSTEPDTLAADLRRLLKDPAERDRMGASGRTWVGEVYGGDAVVQRFEDLYMRVVDNAPSRSLVADEAWDGVPGTIAAMMGKLRSLAMDVRDRWFRRRAPVSGVPLPPVTQRQGGEHFSGDAAFLASAQSEALRLREAVEPAGPLRVVDLGCGSGRLAIGLLEAGLPVARYVGLEVQKHHVQWCRQAVSTRYPHFTFNHLTTANRRYNPVGESDVTWPLPNSTFEVVYAYSVFSHMSGKEVAANLEEARRVLVDGGLVIATAFIEEGCPPEEENPAGYGPLAWEGPLHCVRFEMNYFESIAESAGFGVEVVRHRSDTDGQSLISLRKQSCDA